MSNDELFTMLSKFVEWNEKQVLLDGIRNKCIRNISFLFLFPESLAQEIEMERKARQQTGERDVKSPLQDRPNYYKNSVLFSSAT